MTQKPSFPNGYRKIRTLGTGVFSQTALFRNPEHEEVVVKWPKTKNVEDNWRVHIIQAQEIIQQIQNFPFHVNLPKVLEKTDYYMVESYLRGKCLTDEVYHACSEKEKKAIASKLAHFLNTLHQNTFDSYEAQRCHIEELDNKDLYDRVMMASVQKDELHLLKGLINDSNNHPFMEHAFSLVHGDLFPDNILYDPKTKELSILDFGIASRGSVYKDFAISPMHQHLLPWDLTCRVIAQYNALKKKHPVFIDINLVRDLQLVKIFNTYKSDLFKKKLELENYSVMPSFLTDADPASLEGAPIRDFQFPLLKSGIEQAAAIFENTYRPMLKERLAHQSTPKPSKTSGYRPMRTNPTLNNGR